MTRTHAPLTALLGVVLTLSLAPMPVPTAAGEEDATAKDIGVDPTALSPTVSHPLVAFSTLKRAVFTGKERDPDTGKSFKVRMELAVRDTTQMIAGVEATIVDVTEWADGEVVEKTRDFYAQHASGDVYYVGEEVDDYDGDNVVGHEGQWVAGENGNQAGVFMPAAPKVGDVFEQERAPGIAEDRTKVLAVNRTVKVPAGTFKDCIETEDYDPIGKSTMRKWYCPGVGLVKESSVEKVMELAERVPR